MKQLVFEKFTRFEWVRAIAFGVIAIVMVINPDFLLGDVLYAIIAYLFMNGVLGVADFIVLNKKTKIPIDYVNLIIGLIYISVAVHLIVYSKYILPIAVICPITLMLVKGIEYFVISLCIGKQPQKAIMIILSILVLFANMTLTLFTFGFGVGGLVTLARVSVAPLALCCAYELGLFIIKRNSKIDI